MHDLTFARSDARWERRRRRLRRALAFLTFLGICSTAVYFATRGTTTSPVPLPLAAGPTGVSGPRGLGAAASEASTTVMAKAATLADELKHVNEIINVKAANEAKPQIAAKPLAPAEPLAVAAPAEALEQPAPSAPAPAPAPVPRPVVADRAASASAAALDAGAQARARLAIAPQKSDHTRESEEAESALPPKALRIDPRMIPHPPVQDRLPSRPRPLASLTAAVAAEPSIAVPALDLTKAVRRGDHLVVASGLGEAMLTLIPDVHEHVSALLAKYDVPNGAFAAVEPATGKVLALGSFSRADPRGKPFALRNVAPAASIFKLVTAGALLDNSTMDPDKPMCFHGGKRRIYERHLRDSGRDGRCVDLPAAVAWSLNVPVAKLAVKYLTPASLVRTCEAFGFNVPMPFDLELEPSYVRIPDDLLGFGRAAAGFGDVRLSALHGALLAGAVANGGTLMRPYIVESVRDAAGQVVRQGGPEVLGIALTPAAARRVGRMMALATTEGTGRRHLKRRGYRFLGDIDVPGKTGSLFVYDPFMDYSWFVGYAPAKNPQIAFAAVIGNTPIWHIKSGFLAIEGLRRFFKVELKNHKPPRAIGRRRVKRYRRRG